MHLVVPHEGRWWDVEIGMLLHDQAGVGFDDAAAGARAAMLSRFPGAVELTGGQVGAQYALNGYSWQGGSTSWGYDDSGKPSGLSGDSAAMQAGADIWNTVGADWQFTGGGSTSAGTGACNSSSGMDGSNTVGWGSQSGSTLAVTCTWHNGGNAVEFDMEFDPDWDWTTGSPMEVDLQSVATHEFGHALGLGHSNDDDAVMYFSYSVGTDKRDPRPDDVAAIIAKYGEAGGGQQPTSTPTSTPTSVPEPTPTDTPTPVPTPPSGDPTASPTASPGASPSPSATSPSSSPTPVATHTPTPVRTPTPTPTRTATPPPSLPLSPGINLVGWPAADADPADVLAGMGDVIDVVYGWDPAARRWERYGPGFPDYANTLQRLENGEAYWIIATRQASIGLP
jgi:hypothetical protein